MKKLTAATFFVLIFLSHFGYYFFYAYEQHVIRKDVKEELLAGIPESTLEVFVAEQYGNNIEWEEKGKEFYLEGNLYDVAKIKEKNGKTFIYCLNDKKEKELLKDLAKTVHDNHGNGKSEKQTIKNQLSVYVLYKVEYEPSPISFSTSQYHSYNTVFTSFRKEIAAPPPKA